MDLERGNPFGWPELAKRTGIRLILVLVVGATTILPAYHRYLALTTRLTQDAGSHPDSGGISSLIQRQPDLFSNVQPSPTNTHALLTAPENALDYLSNAEISVPIKRIEITAMESGYELHIEMAQ